MNAAKAIKAHRSVNNLSLRKMAKVIGISHYSLYRFEEGQEVAGSVIAAILGWLLKQETNNAKRK